MLEGFFKKLRGDLSEGPEEVSGSTIPDADTDIVDSVVEELPTIDISSVLEGESSFDRQLMGLLPLPDKEVAHIDVAPRQEHEPYRYEPDGDGQVCVTKAHLYEVHPKTGAVNIHELNKTIIGVSANCVVYTKFKTDPHGAVDPPAYTLHTAEGLPPSTQHILKDEDGRGVNGEYNTPIFYIKDGELDRDHWNNREDNPREVKLYGGLRGHRGPLWWVNGYNSLRNIGGGKNVYKEYIQASDFKDLRTIKDKGGSYDSNDNPYCGTARIRVHYEGEYQADGLTLDPNFDKANANEIVVRGNGYKAEWLVGGSRMGVVEDGLVNCLKSIPTKTLTKKTLQTASVLQAASGTQAQAASSDYSSHKQTAWTGGNSSTEAHTDYTPVSVLPEPTTGDKINVWKGGSTQDGYVGGSISPVLVSFTPTQAASSDYSSHKQTAWTGGNSSTEAHTDYTPVSVLPEPTTGDKINVWKGGSTQNGYVGGSSSIVATSYDDRSDVWAQGSNSDVVTSTTTGSSYKGGSAAAIYTVDAGSVEGWAGGSVGQVVTGSSAGQAWQGGTTAAAITSVGSGNAWTGGSSESNNIVVSATEKTDYVRGGVITEAAGLTKVAIPIEFQGSGNTNPSKWVWVMGIETTVDPASANSTPPTFPDLLHGSPSFSAALINNGDGVESVTLGQGIVGSNIASNAFHNSVDTTASVPSGATLQNVITATTTKYGITREDGDGHDAFTNPNFAVNPTAVTGVLKDLQPLTVVTSATTSPNGIVGASQVTAVDEVNFSAGGVVGATQKKVIADSGSDTVGEIKVLKADTMNAISNVVSAPTTDPVVTGASLTTEFIKSTLPPVTVVGSCNTQQGGIIGATEKKIIADSGSDTVGEIKVLKADTMNAISDVVSAPTTDPVVSGASLTTEFIKATLPSVNIPNVGSPVTVYKENTDWSADLLEPPSNTANIKVAVDPDGDSSVATCGDCGS